MKKNDFGSAVKKDPETPCFVIISAEEVMTRISQYLDQWGYCFCHYPSLESFFTSLDARKKWSGLFVSLTTKIKMNEKDRLTLLALEEIYPVAITKIQTGTNDVFCFSYNPDIGNDLSSFIAYCRNEPPRRIRTQQRKRLHLNLLLCPHEQHPSDSFELFNGEKTFSVNASSGGLFVATATNFKIGQKVILMIPLLEGASPISGDIRWVKEWNEKSQEIPGVGIMIKKMEDIQQDIFERLLLVAARETV